jgi:hypothetical protein
MLKGRDGLNQGCAARDFNGLTEPLLDFLLIIRALCQRYRKYIYAGDTPVSKYRYTYIHIDISCQSTSKFQNKTKIKIYLAVVTLLLTNFQQTPGYKSKSFALHALEAFGGETV